MASSQALRIDRLFCQFSLIAGISREKKGNELTAFSCSYSAAGGTRTRMADWIEYEYDYRFTEYEYELEVLNNGDQREVSLFKRIADKI